MESNIIALLKRNLRVIIPDFGAFIIRQKQPRIIVFNEFLRYNDGLLIDYIVRTEGIDREIAEQRVIDYAEDSTRVLESGRKLVIEGLGTLQKERSGRINFEEMEEIAEIQEVSDEPQVKVPDEIAEPVKEEEASKNEVPAKQEEPVIPVIKPKTKRAPKSKPKPSGKAPLAVEPPKSEEPPVIPAPVLPVIEELPPEPTLTIESSPEQIKPAPVKAQQERTVRPEPQQAPVKPVYFTSGRINRILGWILAILFINAVILAWFVFNSQIRGLFGKKAGNITVISDSVYKQLSDSVRAAALDTSLVFAETASQESNATGIQQSNSRYFIVAGCFRDASNADVLVNSLKQLGYKAERFGKIGNLYAVCFASFSDKDQAVLELKHIREKVPDAWMTRF